MDTLSCLSASPIASTHPSFSTNCWASVYANIYIPGPLLHQGEIRVIDFHQIEFIIVLCGLGHKASKHNKSYGNLI